MAYARNVKLIYYLYRQNTNLFLFQSVSEQCIPITCTAFILLINILMKYIQLIAIVRVVRAMQCCHWGPVAGQNGRLVTHLQAPNCVSSNIYMNKQNGNCACYQFPPCKWCNHLKNWLLFLASPTVDEKLVSNKKWLRKDSCAKFPCFNRNRLKDFRSYVRALSQGAWDVSLNGYQARA